MQRDSELEKPLPKRNGKHALNTSHDPGNLARQRGIYSAPEPRVAQIAYVVKF
jgi:hypothetical protein